MMFSCIGGNRSTCIYRKVKLIEEPWEVVTRYFHVIRMGYFSIETTSKTVNNLQLFTIKSNAFDISFTAK